MIHYILFLTLFTLARSDTPTTYSGSSISDTQSGFIPSSVPSYSSGVTTQTVKNSQDAQSYANSQVLENPSYDPNLYTSFVPHDAVQQYVSAYGGPYAPQGYPHYNPDPAGFTVQTGYEGYLVPAVQQQSQSGLAALGQGLASSLASIYGSGSPSNGLSVNQGSGFASRIGSPFDSGYSSELDTDFGLGFLHPIKFLKAILPLPKTIIGILIKIGAAIFATIGVVFIGGFLTVLLCSFTTVCSVTMQPFLPFLNWQNAATQVTQTIGAELTADRVKRATEFVKSAIEKYQKMQETNKYNKIEEEEDNKQKD